MLGVELAEAQKFVQLAHHDEATVRSRAWSVGIALQKRVEVNLEWLFLFGTQWVWTSGVSSLRSIPHKSLMPKNIR